ncbi:hypothetical protein, partial [Sphingobacterium faecium]|uniref:hypothetical protein n=1 Tax=Sphingobacterium faecium TaxID=34087 RepID=UPI0032096DE3
YPTEYSVNKPQKLKRPIPTELQTNYPTIKYVVRRPDTDNLTAKQIKELRLEESLPVINEMGKWIFEQIKATLP